MNHAKPRAHSEEYFGEYRDFWWNRDFLDLMAKRWDLSSGSTLLDVGSGMCHWSLLLAPHLKPPASVFALDRDPIWAAGNDEIKERFHSLGAGVEFREGNAGQLPFPDDSFDVVTCQTVLIHCADPVSVILEMKRVAKPGGIVICAEPNNLVGTASFDSNELAADVDTLVDKFRERLLYERGRQAVGEGDISLGDQLPFLFSQTGFQRIQNYISDRVNPLYPPYGEPAQMAHISLVRESADPIRRRQENEQNLRYVEALENSSDRTFTQRRQLEGARESEHLLRAIDDKSYFSSGLTVMYLVSGRK